MSFTKDWRTVTLSRLVVINLLEQILCHTLEAVLVFLCICVFEVAVMRICIRANASFYMVYEWTVVVFNPLTLKYTSLVSQDTFIW